MNRTALKNYAPKARREFIQAVTDRAAFYGLTAKKTEPVTEKGDVVIIGGRAFPRIVAKQRRTLEERIARQDFDQVMEAMAYTWFNRFVALRFMELHGYLDHGYRVLSHPEGNLTPEIIEQAEHVALSGLDNQKVIELKLDGAKESELYRLLLVAQCNALHDAMPFLFERIDDETELLLPDNLLHSDSVIRKLVNEIEEEDWKEVEIIGWIYQFYISEKKDQVIGKVVKSEDIPAATQLFTPNWIVKYLVQNTLGRQWLATYPDSPLRKQMEYYIEPAEQTDEVKAQLKAITPENLNPEELTLLDPACGSGHILVEAYDVFKAIYQERGYRSRDIPRIILQKNLYGLEIDNRAAQLAAFALLMKARADDRSIFDSESKPNILAFQDSRGMNAADITHTLNSPIPSVAGGHVLQGDIALLLSLFENAKTFGSLIQVPPKLVEKLPEIERRLNDVLKHGDLIQAPAHVIKPLLQQACFLARQYDAVVGNPPYMGGKYHVSDLKLFAGTEYPESKYDTYAMFIQRGLRLLRPATGLVGLIVMETWMLAPSYEAFRSTFLLNSSLSLVLHMPYEGRGNTVMGISFGLTAFIASASHVKGEVSPFYLVRHTDINCDGVPLAFPPHRRFFGRTDDFTAIPSNPIAYWVSDSVKQIFFKRESIADVAETGSGLQTSDNQRFLRQWHEVT